jgi:hypothetical protein
LGSLERNCNPGGRMPPGRWTSDALHDSIMLEQGLMQIFA